jgi:hypothetical protein
MSSPPDVPDRSADDSDVGWGEPEPAADEALGRLLDERPPHHDR